MYNKGKPIISYSYNQQIRPSYYLHTLAMTGTYCFTSHVSLCPEIIQKDEVTLI